jgi:hypothetical protein
MLRLLTSVGNIPSFTRSQHLICSKSDKREADDLFRTRENSAGSQSERLGVRVKSDSLS